MKTFVNRAKLKGKMAEKGISALSLSKSLCISRQATYRKINGDVDFSENELVILKGLFGNYIFL